MAVQGWGRVVYAPTEEGCDLSLPLPSFFLHPPPLWQAKAVQDGPGEAKKGKARWFSACYGWLWSSSRPLYYWRYRRAHGESTDNIAHYAHDKRYSTVVTFAVPTWRHKKKRKKKKMAACRRRRRRENTSALGHWVYHWPHPYLLRRCIVLEALSSHAHRQTVVEHSKVNPWSSRWQMAMTGVSHPFSLVWRWWTSRPCTMAKHKRGFAGKEEEGWGWWTSRTKWWHAVRQRE